MSKPTVQRAFGLENSCGGRGDGQEATLGLPRGPWGTLPGADCEGGAAGAWEGERPAGMRAVPEQPPGDALQGSGERAQQSPRAPGRQPLPRHQLPCCPRTSLFGHLTDTWGPRCWGWAWDGGAHKDTRRARVLDESCKAGRGPAVFKEQPGKGCRAAQRTWGGGMSPAAARHGALSRSQASALLAPRSPRWGGGRGPRGTPGRLLQALGLGRGPHPVAGGSRLRQDEFIGNRRSRLILGPRVITNKKAQISRV